MPRKPREPRAGDGQIVQYNTIKVRLYPTQAQAQLFENTFGCCRYIWNRMLADQQRFYLETDAHFIPTPAKYKKEAPFLKDVDNQALIQEHNKLSQAFRVFFRNPETFGYPKYTPEQQEFYLRLTEKYQLHRTGGSDFHGEKVKPDVKLAALGLELGWLLT